jgi:uncharacterized membrane protein YgcG
MLRGIGAAVAAAVVAIVFLGAPAVLRLFSGGGQSDFPDPVADRAVYDPAGALSPGIEEVLEAQVDEIENRSEAEVVVFVRIDPAASEESNLADAQALIDQWGVGRAGFDDGFVILLSFDDEQFAHGVLSTYAGGGFRAVYLGEDDQAELRDTIIVPAIRQGALEGGLVEAMVAVDAAVTPEATGRLETYRVLNAMVGIPGSILALLLSLGVVYAAWRRYGDDPDLVDSPSVLMAGPPAGMTPPLATVVTRGRATQHSINTALADLAGKGLIAFRNLDQVGKVKSDDDPDPMMDPAIEVRPVELAESAELAEPQRQAYATIRAAAADGQLTREALWGLNGQLAPLKERLEAEAVRLGWLTQRPTPIITRWVVIGVVEVLVGAGLVFLGYNLPMSGLTLLGAALAVGGIGTVALGNAMSQRTPKGAYVDAMLKAFRRTLQKTMEQARNIGEVIAVPEVRALADTPDKAVVWGIALGLHREVAGVLERGFEDARARGAADGAYYPVWLGSSSSSGSLAATSADGSGMAGLFSGGGTPDIGGMFSALGSVGSSPPSSSSGSGGGFGGGGSSGGGGGSSSF